MAQLTVDLPKSMYESLRKKAKAARRGVDVELVEVLQKALTPDDGPTENVEGLLDGMKFLTDRELRKTAQSARIRKAAGELAELNDKCQRDGLSREERQRREQLLGVVDRFVLIRSEALALLKERGRDVSRLLRT